MAGRGNALIRLDLAEELTAGHTIRVRVGDKYSIDPPEAVFREPLYGGCLEAFPDVDNDRAVVRTCRCQQENFALVV